MVELENQCRSQVVAFKKYQEDTYKNLVEVLPEWKSNLILYTQVAAGSFDLRKVDFDYFKDISTNSLGFDVYHLEGKE
ncbi:hypothetical protein J1N35_005292 [Gossypium stocksii]|uniref:Uncharacterized protein n=1 Tax=Gossypium stocksii TaxID=47602 RepID=A0A9D4AGY4_9ROSI|nr:hypothetical protein J1N35_005292 [Gossypium stocksii]